MSLLEALSVLIEFGSQNPQVVVLELDHAHAPDELASPRMEPCTNSSMKMAPSWTDRADAR
jgi:hypothetical protein